MVSPMPEPMKVTPVSRGRWIVEGDPGKLSNAGKLYRVYWTDGWCEIRGSCRFINPNGPTGRRVIAAIEATLPTGASPPRLGPENPPTGHTDPKTNHQEETIANPPCCNGGPQWGHAFSCPTLP